MTSVLSNDTLRAAFERYYTLELEMLNALSNQTKKKIAGGKLKDYDPNSIRSYGEVTHELRTSNPVHPGFKNGWIFANKSHPVYPKVLRVFLTPSATGVQTETDFGEALGYPTVAGNNEVTFMDETEGEKTARCCVMYEYFCGEGNYAEQIKFFRVHADMFRRVGRALSINLCGNPGLERFWHALANSKK